MIDVVGLTVTDTELSNTYKLLVFDTKFLVSPHDDHRNTSLTYNKTLRL